MQLRGFPSQANKLKQLVPSLDVSGPEMGLMGALSRIVVERQKGTKMHYPRSSLRIYIYVSHRSTVLCRGKPLGDDKGAETNAALGSVSPGSLTYGEMTSDMA